MKQVALIQLAVGVLAIAYGVQAIVLRRQNARMFRPWVEYRPVVMAGFGVFAGAIGILITVSAIVKLLT